MLKKILTLITLYLMTVPMLYAQTGSITGTVIDSKTGEVLPGANVSLTDINQGASTDADGRYTITNIPAGTYTLRISFIGYKTQSREVQVGAGKTVVNIQLKPSNLSLDELVVTGYGEVEKRNYTGSVSTVSSDNFESVSVTSVGQALQGSVAGAEISSSSGTPGAVQEIRIRGLSSINAGVSPLYVIDGVPVVSGSVTSSESGAASSLGVLANLNPSDIESVSILKDAAATAPYGARGANGVIVIKTKEGNSGDVRYSVSVQRGINNRGLDGPDPMSGKQWDKYYRDAVANQSSINISADQVDSPWDGQTSTDWGKVATNENAVNQKYTISARGGSDKTTFYASTNYFNQEGNTIGTGLDRITGKLNLSHKLDEKVSIDNNFTGSYVKQNGMPEGSAWFESPVANKYFLMPIDRVYNEDGTLNTDISNAHYNPIFLVNNDINRKRSYRLLNNTSLDFKIFNNLSYSTNFAIDYLIAEEKYYSNRFHGDAAGLGGRVHDIYNRNFNFVWRNTLNYNWTLSESSVFDLKAISESQRNYFQRMDETGIGIPASGLPNLNTVASPQSVGSLTEDWALQSFTGLINYNFKEKLLVDASIRREGSSRFSEQERWGTFWSVGAGYILTEEMYLEGIDWLNFLKLRASYGKTGNASIGLNQYQTKVGFNQYNNQSSIRPNTLGNRGLTWEKQESIDVGIEFETFNRLDGSVTYFRKNSYDLLFDVPLSRTTGHNSQTQNLGKLYNQGLEIELSVNILQGNNLAWNLGGNFTTLKNEVTELPKDPNGNAREITSSTRYTAVEGYSVGAWYMKEWVGVDPENGDPLWYMNGNNGSRITTNNYSEADSYYQGGNAQPTKYGGLNTRIDLFGFYASANIYYAFGHQIYDNWGWFLENDGTYLFYGQYSSQENYWENPGDRVDNPKPVRGGNQNSNGASSRYLYDGDYLKLKTLNIGYNIPSKYLKNLGLNSATIYFLGRNLWTYVYDDELKFDPSTQTDGLLEFDAPPIKSFTFGIKANF